MERTLDFLFENLERIYLADTFVVKETHWLTKVRGVEPVMSSHWAGVVPPGTQTHDLLPNLSWLFATFLSLYKKEKFYPSIAYSTYL